MTGANLMPCPFCGSTDLWIRDIREAIKRAYGPDDARKLKPNGLYDMGCSSCHCQSPMPNTTVDEMFTKWNTRS